MCNKFEMHNSDNESSLKLFVGLFQSLLRLKLHKVSSGRSSCRFHLKITLIHISYKTIKFHLK